MPTEACILLVEDNRADVFLMREAMHAAGIKLALHLVTDGEQAVQFIDATDADPEAPCPALVLLDLNIPRKSGAEVLRRIRESARCGHARVIIVTSSDSEADRSNAARLGANGYFCKPSNFEEYLKIGEVTRSMLAQAPAAPG